MSIALDCTESEVEGSVSEPVRAADIDRAVELMASAERLRAEAATVLGSLVGSGLAEWLGYVSLERLIAHRTGCGNAVARDVLRVARHLDRFAASGAALRSGELSWAQAEILARAAGDDRAGAFADYEAQLLAAAEGREPEEFARLVRAWQARVDGELDAADAERSWRQRTVSMQFAFDGSCHGRFRLDPVGAEIVANALESPPDPAHTLPEPRSLGQRRADALVELCNDNDSDNGSSNGSGTRSTVDVIVDIETLADNCDTRGATGARPVAVERLRQDLARGGPISGPGLDRLLCDASFRALVVDGPRTVLAYNRATPDIPPGLRRAVRLRDRHCTFTGCDRPAHWADLHHIVPRNRGGPTTIDNLTLLCRHHHGSVHEGGWQLTRGPDGVIRVSSP